MRSDILSLVGDLRATVPDPISLYNAAAKRLAGSAACTPCKMAYLRRVHTIVKLGAVCDESHTLERLLDAECNACLALYSLLIQCQVGNCLRARLRARRSTF